MEKGLPAERVSNRDFELGWVDPVIGTINDSQPIQKLAARDPSRSRKFMGSNYFRKPSRPITSVYRLFAWFSR